MTRQSSDGDFSPNINGNDNNYTIVNSAKRIISNEVKTIQMLVASLTKIANSKNNIKSIQRGKIDPGYKINERFKKYSSQLSLLYVDLSIKYGEYYKDVLDEVQLGTTDTENIGRFLRQISVGTLEKNKNNPIISLDEICTYLEKLFYKDFEEKFEFDHGALRYFIYKQLIECNVFPNPDDYDK